MAKTSKKALGATMAGVMALGAVAGTVGALDQVKVANAAESQAQKDAKAKISHTIYSINKNYAGIKNQAQWEIYIKEARALIAKMPTAEAEVAAELTKQVDGLADTVLAIARINQVEKSYEVNFHGIKNAAQWREYLDLAKEDMKSVDQTVFAAKYAELVERFNAASDKVKKIEDAYAVELADATKLYDAAVKSMNLADAEKALKAAEALGTHATSDKLEADCKALIAKINEKFAVESVSLINAKQIKIAFNKPVDKDSVLDFDNYEVLKAGQVTRTLKAELAANSGSAKAELSSDQKAVVITFGTNVTTDLSVVKDAPFTFIVNGVKSGNEKVEKFTQVLNNTDKVAPQLLSVSATAATTTRTVTVAFSEPVDITSGVYKINGKVASVTNGVKPNEVILTSGDTLNAGTTYELEATNVKDTAGNIIDVNPSKVSFTVTKDASSASIASIEVTEDDTIKVVFDKEMDKNTLNSGTVTVLDANGIAKGTYTVKPVKNDTSKKEYLIEFSAGLYTGVDKENLNIVFTDNVKDINGNKIVSTTKSVTLNKDLVAPKATKVEVLAKTANYDGVAYVNGALVVTFDEKIVDPGATILSGSSVKIIDQDGIDITSRVTLGDPVLDSKDAKKLVIPFTANTIASTSKTGTVRISEGITTDASLGSNKNEAATFNNVDLASTVSDTVKPVVSNIQGATKNTITFDVTESDLDNSSVQNIDNYRLDGKPLPSGSYVTIVSGTPNSVTVYLPSGSIEKTRTNYAFTVTGIKDKSGNVADTVAVNNVSLTDDVKPVLTSSKINTDDTITLTFSENVTGTIAADFEIYVNGKVVKLPSSAYTVNDITSGSDKGAALVTLKFVYEDKDSNPSSGDEKLYIDIDGSGAYNAGDILLLQGSYSDENAAKDAYGSSVVKLDDLNSIKVKTSNVTVGNDGITANTIKSGTTITVK